MLDAGCYVLVEQARCRKMSVARAVQSVARHEARTRTTTPTNEGWNLSDRRRNLITEQLSGHPRDARTIGQRRFALAAYNMIGLRSNHDHHPSSQQRTGGGYYKRSVLLLSQGVRNRGMKGTGEVLGQRPEKLHL